MRHLHYVYIISSLLLLSHVSSHIAMLEWQHEIITVIPTQYHEVQPLQSMLI